MKSSLIIAGSIVSGFLGGLVSNYFVQSQRMPLAIPMPAVAAIRASRFEIVDQRGRVRATLGVNQFDRNQSPVLVFNDQNGKTRAALGLGYKDNPGLMFSDQQWEGRLSLGYLPGDASATTEDDWGLIVRASTGRPVVSLGDFRNTRGGSVAIDSSDGKLIWKSPRP